MEINKIINAIVKRYGTADPFEIADRLNVQVEWCKLGPFPLGKTVYDKKEPIMPTAKKGISAALNRCQLFSMS